MRREILPVIVRCKRCWRRSIGRTPFSATTICRPSVRCTAAMQAGLSIPGDIAFAGCGNLRYADYFKVPLTSVDQSIERMGEAAARRVLTLSTTPGDAPQTTLLEPRLIVRRSTVAGCNLPPYLVITSDPQTRTFVTNGERLVLTVTAARPRTSP